MDSCSECDGTGKKRDLILLRNDVCTTCDGTGVDDEFRSRFGSQDLERNEEEF